MYWSMIDRRSLNELGPIPIINKLFTNCPIMGIGPSSFWDWPVQITLSWSFIGPVKSNKRHSTLSQRLKVILLVGELTVTKGFFYSYRNLWFSSSNHSTNHAIHELLVRFCFLVSIELHQHYHTWINRILMTGFYKWKPRFRMNVR